jgi:hypothetical protein
LVERHETTQPVPLVDLALTAFADETTLDALDSRFGRTGVDSTPESV